MSVFETNADLNQTAKHKDIAVKPYIILTLFVALAFANSLQNSFVWDDQAFIVENPKINLPLKEIPSVFTTPMWKLAGFHEAHQVYYRPIAYIYSVLNYKIWGANPLGFHLTNIILHLIVTIILYKTGLLLFRLSSPLRVARGDESPINNDKLISLIAASIFAVHPVHNESVGRVAIGEVIFGFFIILSLYFFLREKRYISWITFFLALLSKEAAVMLPFALIILSIHKKGFKRGIIEIIPYFALVGVYLILRMRIVDAVFGYKVEQSIFTRIFTMAAATLDYIRLLIIPYPLSPFYPARWYTSILEPKVLIAILLLILILLLAFKFKKDTAMLFLLTFPFIMLAPVIWRTNTFPAKPQFAYIAERFLYVPVMSSSLFISASIARLIWDKRKNYLIIGFLPIIITFAIITVSSNTMWKDNLALFTRIVKESPRAVFAHINIGLIYFNQGRLDEAIQKYLDALKLKPDYHVVHYNLGLVYHSQKRLDEAIREYSVALKLNPASVSAYNNIGTAYMALGLTDNAIKHYQTALGLNPNHIGVHYNFGIAYKQKGLINEAIKEFQTALKIQPDFTQARKNLESLQK